MSTEDGRTGPEATWADGVEAAARLVEEYGADWHHVASAVCTELAARIRALARTQEVAP